MNRNVAIRLAIIDCSVRVGNLPARLPADMAGKIERVVENEKKNSERISQFYRRQISDFSGSGGKKIDLAIIPMEGLASGARKEYDAFIIPDSYHTPTRENVKGNETVQKSLEFVQEAHQAGKIILGVGYGYQLISAVFGEYPVKYLAEDYRLIDYKQVGVKLDDGILNGVEKSTCAIFNNRYCIKNAPKGAEVLMIRGEQVGLMAAFRIGNSTYGFQFMLDYKREDLKERVDMYAEEAMRNGYKIKIGPFAQNYYGEAAEQNNARIVQNFLKIASDKA